MTYFNIGSDRETFLKNNEHVSEYNVQYIVFRGEVPGEVRIWDIALVDQGCLEVR